MIKFMKKFAKEEDGAVTVDWVVLTAAVVGLGVAGVATVQGGINTLSGTIETNLNGASTGNLGSLAGGGAEAGAEAGAEPAPE